MLFRMEIQASMSDQEFSIFLKPYHAVYIDIAKVASSSLKAAFASVLGLDLNAVGGNPHEVEYPCPPESNRAGTRLYPGLYTFAFVRNPWDRLLSCFRDKIQGEVGDFTLFSQSGVARCLQRFDAFSANMSFEEFVYAVSSIPDADADEHFRSQHTFLTNDQGEIAVDFVGRYETLEADFRYVAGRIRLPEGISLPRLQSNPREFVTRITIRPQPGISLRRDSPRTLRSFRINSVDPVVSSFHCWLCSSLLRDFDLSCNEEQWKHYADGYQQRQQNIQPHVPHLEPLSFQHHKNRAGQRVKKQIVGNRGRGSVGI